MIGIAARDLVSIAPELVLSGLAMVILILAASGQARGRRLGWVSCFALLATGVVLIAVHGGTALSPSGSGPEAGAFPIASGAPSFLADGFAFYFKLLILTAGVLSVALALRDADDPRMRGGEFFVLVLFATVGMMIMASGADLTVLYLGLETMSLAIYVLVGYAREDARSGEAALKYFLLGAFASAVFLYGVSLVYATTGATHLADIARAIATGGTPSGTLKAGVVLITVGLAFKVAAAPFHMWTPDAYEGAPTAVTAFMAAAVKTAAFAMMIRVFVIGFPGVADLWTPLLALLAAASMCVGNIAAILQTNVKRLLAYSSIAHAGYALMGIVVFGARQSDVGIGASGLAAGGYGLNAVLVYLGAYLFMTLGAFAVVVAIEKKGGGADRIEDFAGRARSQPALGFAMIVFLLSLAGIPCTAGFIGKWWLFGSAIQGGYAWLAVLAVANSAISLYYYIRIAVAMVMEAPVAGAGPARSPAVAMVVLISLAATLGIGLVPGTFLALASSGLMGLATFGP